jgi:hypothetical protein
MSLRARALLCRGESRGTSTRGRRRRRARERGKRRRKRREGGQMRGRRMARFTPMTRGRGQSLERRLLMTDGECHLVKNLPCPLLLSLPPDLPIGGVLLLHTDLPIGGVGHLHAPPPVTATPMRGPADPSERAHHDCLSPPCRLLAVLIEIVRLIQLTQMTFYKWNTTLRPSSFPPSRLEGGLGEVDLFDVTDSSSTNRTGGLQTEVMDTCGTGDEMKAWHEEMTPRISEADDAGSVKVVIRDRIGGSRRS